MAYKDPFESVPPIPKTDEHDLKEFHDVPNEEFTKGNAPRNLANSVKKALVPILGVAVLAYVFWPDAPRTVKIDSGPPATVDDGQQASDVDTLMTRLKDEAEKDANNKLRNKPATESREPSNSSDKSSGLSAKERELLAKLADDMEKREENIRASSLEAGTLTLVKGSATEKVATALGSASNELQSQIDTFNRNRAASEQQQTSAQEKLLAAMAPKENLRQKSANEEYVAQQAIAGSSTSLPLLKQQPAVARYVITESTPIRAVLLTGVKSDLPGKIRAMVTSDVYDSNQECVLIPKGSILVGAYNSAVIVGQQRILIGMSRLILGNNTWVPLAGSAATDMIGQSGIEAEVDNHFWEMFKTSMIIGGTSLLLPKDQNTISSIATSGGVQNGGSVLALTLNDILKTTLERNRVIQPTLTLQAGEPFMFTVAHDISMVPYK